MASHFTNRLVGVTIVVASVVIFLPSIIDGKKMAYEDEFVATPIKPEMKAHTIVRTQAGSSEAQGEESAQSTDEHLQTSPTNGQWEVEEVAQTITIASSETIKETGIHSVADHQQTKVAVLENAWTIQLGAFQNAKNINILLKKLHKAGFQAHTVPTEVIDGELTRVFVGPDVSKNKLEKQLPQLKHLTQLQGKIMPFNAVNP